MSPAVPEFSRWIAGRGNIVVVARRTALEETRAEQRQELVQNLEEGQVIDGVVKNIPIKVVR